MESPDSKSQVSKRSVGDRRRRLDPEAAFRVWAAMGPTRSYSAVADQFGVADSTVLRLARRQCWDDRLTALERPVKEEGEEQLRQSVQQMNERHIAVARKLVEKGAEALCFLEPSSVAEALRLVETGSKLERQALGEPDSKKQITVETILRERFEALVVHDDARAIGAQRPRPVTIDVPSLDEDDGSSAPDNHGDDEQVEEPEEKPKRSLGIFEGWAGQAQADAEANSQ